jgi:hypothetical protein
LLGGISALLVQPIERTQPLSDDIVWTFDADAAGGYTANASAGLVLEIPPGALDAPVTFTVTALAGSAVAYRFEPHIEFAENVVLTQSLSGTNAIPLQPMVGGHFASDTLQLNSGGLAVVTELVSAQTNPLANSVKLSVGHFSGWVLASGRSDPE